MAKRLLFFFLALLMVSCATINNQTSKTANSTPSLPEKSKAATVAFITTGLVTEDSYYPYCTGVWINRDTLMTALHCAAGNAKREKIRQLPKDERVVGNFLIDDVKDPTGTTMNYSMEDEVVGIDLKPKRTHAAKVVAIDSPHDLALLKADSDIPHHNWLRIADEMPKVGEKLYIVGHPGGLYFTFFDGIMAAIRETFPQDEEEDEVKMEGPFLQIYSGIYHGNSGGPVISEKGEIVGIVSFIARSPNQGFAIACPSLKHFVLESNLKHKI
jgi:S1-C subfamily serine protease